MKIHKPLYLFEKFAQICSIIIMDPGPLVSVVRVEKCEQAAAFKICIKRMRYIRSPTYPVFAGNSALCIILTNFAAGSNPFFLYGIAIGTS